MKTLRTVLAGLLTAGRRVDRRRATTFKSSCCHFTRYPNLSLVLGIARVWLFCGNAVVASAATVVINEWLIKPDPPLESYIELYNPTASAVDLSGYFLSDSPTNSREFAMPVGIVISPGGFLVFSESQFSSPPPFDFALSLDGGFLGLFTPAGALVDGVNYGPQRFEISQGRVPDGGPSILFLGRRSPGSRNALLVTTTNDAGIGSLRQAILEANAAPGADTIGFNIPGVGPHTILPATALPEIISPATLDGYTQAGSSPNTLSTGDNAVLRIHLSGANAGTGVAGLRISTSNCIVRGLVFSQFNGSGLRLETNGNHVIQGNFLGTDPTGAAALPNGSYGIRVNRSANNLIGGTTPEARNLIDGVLFSLAHSNVVQGNYVGTRANGLSAITGGYVDLEGSHGNRIGGGGAGNVIGGSLYFAGGGSGNRVQGNLIGVGADGFSALQPVFDRIYFETDAGTNNVIGTDADGLDDATEGNIIARYQTYGIRFTGGHRNRVAGNRIGTDATGTVALGGSGGVDMDSSNGNVIGGLLPVQGNLISGNSGYGVGVSVGNSNVILGNSIGTTVDGSGALGNGRPGVALSFGAQGTLVASNSIAYNLCGVALWTQAGAGNTITRNFLYANTGLGIDLGYSGSGPGVVTPNDASLDSDSGPNNLQNFPVLTRATRSGNVVQVDGSLNSAAARVYTVEFFSSPTADASGYGEGQSFLDSHVVATDGAGNAPFSLTFAAGVPAGHVVTATATDSFGNTSEFSPAIPLADSTTGLVFTVTSTFDFGAGSLRQAILDANSVPGLDTIAFNVVGGGISVQSALPTITDPVVVDGYTQPGAAPAGNGQPATGLFELNGGPADTGIVHGLHLQTSNCVVRGLTLGSFSGYAIWLDNAPGNRIEGNHIGTDEFDADNIGNGLGGILISNSPNNTVGGTNEAARNVISGNDGHGILITGASASNNVVSGNYAGVDASGLSAIGNDLAGVLIADAPGNIIGGINSMSEGNVISGNNGHGLLFSGAGASNNIVNGNFIGTDATGNGALGNFGDGVVLMGSSHNGIGANNGSPNINIISGNSGSGVRVENAFDNFIGGNNGIGWSFHAVRGPIANGADGVLLTNASANLVGYNKLSGNTRHGLRIAGSGSVSNIVAYNHVGGLGHGYVAPNGLGGILIENAAATRVLENSVLGNDGGGVALVQAANTRLQLNLIGQANPGQSNLNYGVLVQDSTGVSVEEGNIISGNAGPGLVITGDLSTVAISQCSIFANSGLGIDLGGDGVTLNDPGDADDSPNHFQNFPVLTAASSGSNTIVIGTLNSTPNTMFRLEFFGNASVDGTGYGEGQTFLGSTNVTTDGGGDVGFTFITPQFVPPGQFVTATTTDPAGNTSEFSLARQVTGQFRIGVEGGGNVTKTPDKPAYSLGESVTLTATNSRYHQFAGWSDGNTNPVRTVTAGATNLYVALFTSTVPLETLLFKQWERSYGGTEIEFPWAALRVPTGGWLVGGLSRSDVSGNKTSPNFGGNDPWLLHVDDNGAVLWDRDYGTTNDAEYIGAIVPLGDGYLLVGQIGNFNPDYWVPDGDVLLIRIDAAGAVQWQRRLGGDGWDYIWSAVKTRDGGVMVVGSSDSNPGGDKTSEHLGSFDGWLVKLDASGNKQWDRSYGGASWDEFQSVAELSDGSLILAGWTKPGPLGNYDVWAVKVDAGGVTIWDQVYGSSGIELGGTVLPLVDGGFLIGATAAAPGEGGNRTASGLGGDDYWLIRIDASGNKIWDRTYGGSGDEWPWRIQPQPDGRFVLIGVSNSDQNDQKTTPNHGGFDIWMLGLDASGNVRWDYSLGGSGDEWLHLDGLLDTPDGGWLVSGSSSSPPSGNKEAPNYGTNDAWIVKLATREAPVGTPAILVNGRFHPGNAVTVSNVATVEIQTSFPNGVIFYTLDGSTPENGAAYTGPFVVSAPVTVRAIAFTPGFVQSAEADPLTIIVRAPPVIIAAPQSQTVIAGANLTFGVTAAGTAPLSYQWSFNGGLLPDATNATLLLSSVATNQAGSYVVAVSNPFGQVLSPVAALTVFTPVAISVGPMSTNVALGSNVTLCVSATGTPPLLYQWRKNSVNIPGATDACLVITNAQVSDGASYTVVVANDAGSVIAGPAVLAVTVPSPPLTAFNDYFTNRAVLTGVSGTNSGTNIFATKETGERNHAGKPGGASVWYTWTAPSDGIARFRTTGSTFDTLLAVYTGTNVIDLSAVASDDDHGGFLASEVQFNAVSNIAYQVAIDGLGGAQGNFVLERNFEASTNSLPIITLQPCDATVRLGEMTTFTVAANPASVTYQWLFRGQEIALATNASYTVSNAIPANVGFYAVRVSNSATQTLSRAALLEIGPFPDVRSKEKIEDLETASPCAGGSFPTGTGSLSRAFALQATFSSSVAMGSIDTHIMDGTATNNLSDCVGSNCGGIIAGARFIQFNVEPTASNATFIIDTSGSTSRTVLWVCKKGATVLDPREFVTCDRDSAPDGQSLVSFPADAGRSYLVWVGKLDNSQGVLQLNWKLGRPPIITSNLSDQLVIQGSDLVIVVPATNVYSASATNRIPLPTYQWFHNGQWLPGRTDNKLTLSNIQATNAGNYTVVVSNAIGATRVGMQLDVLLPSPGAQIVRAGESTTLHAPATQTACSAFYQWLVNGIVVTNGTSRTLQLDNTQLSAAGQYAVVVSNCSVVVTSLVATVAVEGRLALSFCDGREVGALKFPATTNPACGFVLESVNDLGELHTNPNAWQPILTTDLHGYFCLPPPTNEVGRVQRFYRARLLPCD